jgi:CubicO group peptidase (beta-lactamase class C family)
MPDFHKPLQALDDWVDSGVVRGASAAIWWRGEIVALHHAGFAREGQAVDERTLFALASVSKPITAALVMRIIELHNLSLDTPVEAVLPRFGSIDDPLDADAYPQLEALRDRITIRHILCHVSGLPENIGVKRLRMRDKPTLERMLDLMCGLPLQSVPGEELRYSNVGFGVAARLVERATGTPFHQMLKEEILTPMGLHDLVVGPDASDRSRIGHTDDAASAGTEVESYNSLYWQDLGIPWGGFYGTTHDVLRFACSFLPAQDRVTSDVSTAQMIVDQTGGVPGGVNSANVHWDRGSWGLGWEVAGDKPRHWTGTLRSPRTWCHWGQSGTLVWVDPERELGLAVFGNRTVHKPWPLVPPRWSELSDAVVQVADESPSP